MAVAVSILGARMGAVGGSSGRGGSDMSLDSGGAVTGGTSLRLCGDVVGFENVLFLKGV